MEKAIDEFGMIAVGGDSVIVHRPLILVGSVWGDNGGITCEDVGGVAERRIEGDGPVIDLASVAYLVETVGERKGTVLNKRW